MQVTIRPRVEVELPGRLQVAAIGGSGYIGLLGGQTLAVVAPDGSVAHHEVVDGPVHALDIDASGRLVVADTIASGPRVRVVDGVRGNRVVDDAATRGLVFDTGVGAAVLWAGEDELWLAAAETEGTDSAIRVIETRSGEILAETVVRDPGGGSALRLRHGPNASVVFANLDAGQHGIWGRSITRIGRALRATPLADGGVITTQYAIDEHAMISLEQYDVVRRVDGVVVGRAGLPSRGFPVALTRASSGRALVTLADERLELWLVDEETLSVRAELVLPPEVTDFTSLTRSERLAIAITSSWRGPTRVSLCEVPA